MTELQKVSAETMRFMRGKCKLDEVPGKYYKIWGLSHMNILE